jgi:hypothetical protein
MPDIRTELSENVDESEWDWLIPHAKRDVVIVVSQLVDLIDVGVAIASDKTSDIQVWMDEALLTKPSTKQLSEWNADPSKRFNTLIVQPFVLVQEK